MKNIEQESLSKVLSATGIREIPEEYSGKGIWVRAIVKVQKKDATKSYCVAINDGHGNPNILIDFGNISPIFKIVEIRPYEMLYQTSIQRFAPNDRVNRLAYVKEYSSRKNVNFDDFSLEELKEEIVCISINKQLKNIV